MDKQKILIADDEPGVRLLVSRMLEEDYIVLEAADGEEAIDIAKGQQPAIVLMDLMMPKMDGYSACFRIKSDEATKGIKVLILTAVGHELNKKYAKEMCADGYITKPFTYESLVEEMRRLMSNQEYENPEMWDG